MKKFLFKLLVGRKAVGQAVRYVASFLASALITYAAGAPGWLQGLIEYVSDNSGIQMTEAGITALLTLVIAEIAQAIVEKSNATGVGKIQEALGEIKDDWAGTETQAAVEDIKKRYNSAMVEVGELREAIGANNPPSTE